MKSTPRAYAQALFELTQDSSKVQLKDIIGRFLQDLKNQNMLSKVEKILQEYEKLNDQAEAIVRATITSVHKLSKTSLNEATKLILQRVEGKKVIWTQNINPKILGGLSISCGDLIIDMSLANRVSELSAQIKK